MSLPSARSIAFNRRISAKWLKEGLRLRAEGIDGDAWVEDMRRLISVDISGHDSIQKSLRYLRHSLVEPGELESLREEAVRLYASSNDPVKDPLLSWGLVAASYPFLQEVAASIGRMMRIQPELKLEQLLRKLTESFGEKETVRRSGRYSLGLIQDLGFVSRTKKVGYYETRPPVKVTDSNLASWFIKIWFFAAATKGPIDRVALTNHPSLFFLDVPELVAYALKSGVLIVDRMSLSQDTVRLAV